MSDGLRDVNGQFKKGHPGGPGRPKRAVEQSYLRALRDNLPVEVWGQIVAKAVALALEGDATARQWLGRYAMGAEPPTLRQLAGMKNAAGSVDEAIEQAIQGDAQFEKMRLDAGVI